MLHRLWKTDKAKLEVFSASHPIILTLIIFLAFTIVVVIITRYLGFYDRGFLSDILVEMHGMVLDLFFFGIIILLLNKLGERHQTIQRYREEIEDYLGWEADEAKHRIIGNIWRLNRLGVTDINLNNAYLTGANLNGAHLKGAHLGAAHLERANLVGAHLEGAYLSGARLENANLNGAHLEGTHLVDTHLENAYLVNAHLEGADMWGTHLEGANLVMAHLEGAKLMDHTYNDETIWPEGSKVIYPPSRRDTQTHESEKSMSSKQHKR